MSTPQVTAFSVGPLDNNVYILTCPTSGKRVLIDPATDAPTILAHLSEPKVEYILLTHGDTDHWLALDAVRAATGASCRSSTRQATRQAGFVSTVPRT